MPGARIRMIVVQKFTAPKIELTPEIATALADRDHGGWAGAHRIDTTRAPTDCVAEALDICRSSN